MTNEYFERKHSLRAVDVVFERAVRCYWFECAESTDPDHMTKISGRMHTLDNEQPISKVHVLGS